MHSLRLARDFERAATLRTATRDRGGSAAVARSVRAAVARLAQVDPDAPVAALEVLRHQVEHRDGLRVEDYEFASTGRTGIRATLLVPADLTAPRGAVLVSPGRRAVLEQVTGAHPADYPDRNIAERLSRAGLVTLTLDYGLDGVLPAADLAGRDEAAVLALAFSLGGRPLLGALVEDNLAALAWLREHPAVDPGRVGLFGHSLGGAVALHTALLSRTPLPLCVAAHFGSYPALYAQALSGNAVAALPGILRHADLPELYAALEPRPLQIQYGTKDPGLLAADAAAAADTLQTAWPADAQERPQVLGLEIGHATDTARALEFFERSLARPSASRPTVPPLRVRFDLEARLAVADRVDDALASGVLTLGPVLADFESRAQPWVGRPAAGVSSGSAALEIAFRAIGVTGRTVLVPVNTFFATAASAVRAGARVDFVDMELDGLGLDPDALEAALERHPDTAAVAAVHIGGVVSPSLERVRRLCEARGIALVEDAAHAIGSRLNGRLAGTFGEFGAFSLYPTKVLTSAEGGIVTAATEHGLDAALRLRDHGKTGFESMLHDSPGGNWRLSEVHAAVGLAHLDTFAEMTAERRRLAAWYDEALADLPALTPYRVPDGVEANGYKYLAYLPEGVDRTDLKQRLRARHGVSLAGEVYSTLLHQQPYFAPQNPGDDAFPRACWFADRHIALPLFPSMTTQQQELTVAALRAEL
ncbi:perosamine synthetase [Kitasatospora sp. GP30]|uniref:DegT/DnrJ/EryC1/StrS family aminotransferase n=1 Tax=Kitasatospora sp. GP30 TaxID=3035084 RepID=UPI000C7072B3|nr:DegT/DnrJ/EryC1/StrS family aminotransferase [Kitasatospora sp. GP30]MDH6140347.1 perosamine synthetase [Kitasatospora sp. GP30]